MVNKIVMDKHVVIKGSSDKCKDALSRWFNICTTKNLPYIQTLERTKLCDIQYDYISLNFEQEALLNLHEESIKQGLQAIYEKYKTPKSNSQALGIHVAFFNNFLVSDANTIASEVYDLIQGYTSGSVSA